MHAVRAARAFDGTGFLAGGATVLVEDGRIAGVEPFGCDLPQGCEVTTYTGTLLPGLVDTHVHLVTDGGTAALDRVAGYTEEELDVQEPRIVAAGPPITTPGGHCHFMGGEVDGPDQIRAALRERVDQGVDRSR
jgi:cytosine/adenosine deaminase-related metal-dependent hydrolase